MAKTRVLVATISTILLVVFVFQFVWYRKKISPNLAVNDLRTPAPCHCDEVPSDNVVSHNQTAIDINGTRQNHNKINPTLQGLQRLTNKMRNKFPDAIIIGAKKGGTRALIEMLKVHPKIKITGREMHYFSLQYDKGLDWYVNQMPARTSKDVVIMEKSPTYLASSEAPMRLYSDQPKPTKLILIVRNPIDRAVSDYLHNIVADKRVLPKFEEMVIKDGEVNAQCKYGLLYKSLYDEHFERWLEWFNRSEILVVNSEKLVTNPVSVLNEIEIFLKVRLFFKNEIFIKNPKSGFYCWRRKKRTSASTQCLGGTKGVPHPEIDKDVMEKLTQYFNPHMIKFCELASVNYSWCNSAMPNNSFVSLT